MITEIEDFFSKGCGRCDRFATADCSTRQWAAGLSDLRRICLEAGLVETVRWGHPCYRLAERNIALLGAFRGDFRITFFNAALMTDPQNILERPGPNAQHASMVRLTANAQAAALEPVLRSYLKEAIGYAAAGTLPPKAQAEFDLPDELIAALDADPELAEAFHSLTPGRQRSYVIHLNGAKTAATRASRIAKFRAPILAGKGATER